MKNKNSLRKKKRKTQEKQLFWKYLKVLFHDFYRIYSLKFHTHYFYLYLLEYEENIYDNLQKFKTTSKSLEMVFQELLFESPQSTKTEETQTIILEKQNPMFAFH